TRNSLRPGCDARFDCGGDQASRRGLPPFLARRSVSVHADWMPRHCSAICSAFGRAAVPGVDGAASSTATAFDWPPMAVFETRQATQGRQTRARQVGQTVTAVGTGRGIITAVRSTWLT